MKDLRSQGHHEVVLGRQAVSHALCLSILPTPLSHSQLNPGMEEHHEAEGLGLNSQISN